jgi:hypothetical protein
MADLGSEELAEGGFDVTAFERFDDERQPLLDLGTRSRGRIRRAHTRRRWRGEEHEGAPDEEGA